MENKQKVELTVAPRHTRSQIYMRDYNLLREWADAPQRSKIIVVADENTAEHCLGLLEQELAGRRLDLVSMPAGETHKNLATCLSVWEQMKQIGADRHSLCINLGGGVVGDLGGFCAATYMRGMDFVQVPTSLLAMVDASVGGKLGIDHSGLKNYVGLVQQPALVVVDPRYLKTLPERELRSGYAEVLKHGLVADKAYWEACASGMPAAKDESWSEIIFKSIEIKAEVVRQDPYEGGLRKVLNFGHTVGHALETYFLGSEQELLHGEAVALGMQCEAQLSADMGLLDEAELDEIQRVLKKVYGTDQRKGPDMDAIWSLMLKDKKNHSGVVRAALLNGIGICAYDISVERAAVERALRMVLG